MSAMLAGPGPQAQESVAIDLGVSFPFDKALAALFDLLKVNRETMSQTNRDRLDDLGIRVLELTIGKALDAAKNEPKP